MPLYQPLAFPASPARHPGYQPGRVYPIAPFQSASGATLPADSLVLMPFMAEDAGPINGIAFRIQAAGGSGGAVKVGLWELSAASGAWLPAGVPIAANNTGASVEVTSSLVVSAVPPVLLRPGRAYATGMLANTAGATATGLGLGNNNMLFAWIFGNTHANTPGAMPQSWETAATYASTDITTLNLTGASFTSSTAARLLPFVQRAA